MGEGREDTDLRRRAGTEPGLGAGGAPASGHAPVGTAAVEDGPEAVDFDALHAALGDPLELDELPPAAIEGDEERVGESSGATNAAYASARPRTIPPSYAPVEDLNAPPVIVASEDTVPSAPPNMTVPVASVAHGQRIGHTPQSGVPFIAGAAVSNPIGGGRAPSGPQLIGHPGSGPHTASAPPPFATPPMNPRAAAQMTMRMPERPLVPPGANAINARRGKTPTLVVRPRGPSAKQKLLAFMAMLLLVTACGIAVIIWRKPRWIGLDPAQPVAPATSTPAVGMGAPPDPSAALAPSAPATATAPAIASAAHPSASASAAASAAASVAPVKARPRPPAPPASALLPRQ